MEQLSKVYTSLISSYPQNQSRDQLCERRTVFLYILPLAAIVCSRVAAITARKTVRGASKSVVVFGFRCRDKSQDDDILEACVRVYICYFGIEAETGNESERVNKP